VGLTVVGILLQAVASPDENQAKKEKGDEPEEKKKEEKKPDSEAKSDSDSDDKRDSWWRKLFPTRKAA
jgi:hypothetical protein